MPKERSPGQTAVSISIPMDLLEQIDARAEAGGMTRSAYLNLVAKHDVKSGGPLPGGDGWGGKKPLDLTSEVYDFLLAAVPAMEAFSAHQEKQGKGRVPAIEVPDGMGGTRLWRFFLMEREEILLHKYLRSKELGFDIGLSRAIKEWLQDHRALWAEGLGGSDLE